MGLRSIALFLVVYAMATHVAATTVTLSAADQQCFFSTLPAKTCTPLRSCRTCLNANVAAAPCFLDARGLCLSMDSYDAPRSDGLVAANTTYCETTDPVCTQCLETNPPNGVCTGREGECVCLSVCESPTWEENAKAAVRVASSSVTSPSVVSATYDDATHTSLAVVLSGIVACVVVVALLANTARRRCHKKPAQPAYAYNMALTPTAVLPPKTLSGRV